MSYTPTEWESTDVVTATRMNALEQAVGDMNMSYTPNTWTDGDILSAEKMNALEQAVASGGGGSSDFSTAEVTLICNAANEVTCGLATVKEPMPPFAPQAETQSLLSLYDGDEFTLTAVLYKGRCRFGALNATALSGTGDVQDITPIDAIITGDCTITIS